MDKGGRGVPRPHTGQTAPNGHSNILWERHQQANRGHSLVHCKPQPLLHWGTSGETQRKQTVRLVRHSTMWSLCYEQLAQSSLCKAKLFRSLRCQVIWSSHELVELVAWCSTSVFSHLVGVANYTSTECHVTSFLQCISRSECSAETKLFWMLLLHFRTRPGVQPHK